jgi:hypothetical protein
MTDEGWEGKAKHRPAALCEDCDNCKKWRSMIEIVFDSAELGT